MHDADILFKSSSDISQLSPTKVAPNDILNSIEEMETYRDSKNNVISAFTYARESDGIKTRKSDGLVYHKQGQVETENALRIIS
jgi:hypothetical protein